MLCKQEQFYALLNIVKILEGLQNSLAIDDANAIQDGAKDSQLALKSSFALMPEDNDELQKIYLQTQRRRMQIIYRSNSISVY